MVRIIPHPFPYQGSKRNIAHEIITHIPRDIGRLIEPFAGSAAITLASAYYGKASLFVLNDINKPLIMLWDEIINHPTDLADAYEQLWLAQQGQERASRIIISFHDLIA